MTLGCRPALDEIRAVGRDVSSQSLDTGQVDVGHLALAAGLGGAGGAIGRVGPQINDSWLDLARRNGRRRAANPWKPWSLTGRMHGSTLWGAGIGTDLGVPSEWIYQRLNELYCE
jgi:hypothetical protein